MSETFNALVLTEDDGKTLANLQQLTEADLPEGDVLLAVDYSCMNYKDALAVTGKGKIVRTWPMVPGVDFVGRVLSSENPDYQAGQQVVLTGWGVGERYWGGYSQRQRVQSKWLVPLVDGLTPLHAMAIGTAGFTAMQCVMALEEQGITPDKGKVLVTGAAGGVGSVAVSLLSKAGYSVSALVREPDEETREYLSQLGASDIVVSDETWQQAPRPLEGRNWAGVVDTVGGVPLARALAEMDNGGCIAACGLAAGAGLDTTVMPFILRGVTLRGIDSVTCPTEQRLKIWQRLAATLSGAELDTIAQVISLAQVPEYAAALLQGGQLRGRCIVDVNQA